MLPEIKFVILSFAMHETIVRSVNIYKLLAYTCNEQPCYTYDNRMRYNCMFVSFRICLLFCDGIISNKSFLLPFCVTILLSNKRLTTCIYLNNGSNKAVDYNLISSHSDYTPMPHTAIV